MSKKFRLKPEAHQFFKSDLATKILDLYDWKQNNVSDNALEEVKEVYLKFGHERHEGSFTSLSGWDEKGTRFHFTICFPSTTHSEHDKFSKGNVVRKLMDILQSDCDRFFQEFINNDLQEKHQ